MLWSVAGAGKTTTVKKMINELIKENTIAGCIYLTPSPKDGETAYKWFQRETSDWFGPIIPEGQKLSSLLGYEQEKPFVIVLDQFEGSFAFVSKIEALVRWLAYDSSDCKTYITLAVTSDVHNAEALYALNGGTKISFLGTHNPWDYRWAEAEVEAWVDGIIQADEGLKVLLEQGSDLRRELVQKAVAGGTPQCLVEGLRVLEDNGQLDAHSLTTYIATCEFGWNLGKSALSSIDARAKKNMK